MAHAPASRASWLLFGPAVAWLLLCVGGIAFTMHDPEAWSPVDRAHSRPVGSSRCAACHPRQHETWSRSYHRTMTQRAEGEAVLAPFAGESLRTLGFVATMTRSAEGRPHMRVERIDPGPGHALEVLDVDVALTVGSHRYQQYVAWIDRGGGPRELWRLPLAWHVGLDRWVHINEAFLTPEGRWGDEGDYLRHLSRWNDNCIFCHNTEPVPGIEPDGRWSSEVAELGIACEACHGMASDHVQRQAWPLRRMLAVTRDLGDPSIAQPERLSSGRAADICGRCHGNRITADLGAVLRDGDGFVPGHALADVSRPILRESTLEGQPGQPFAERFWPDGTPRLSAYEYQALLLSPCHQRGRGMGCGDCHTMHGPQPAMQLRPDYEPAAVCGRCHAPDALSDARTPGGHGRHGSAVDCDGCHLPRITYGLLEGMMSHRPTRPRPQDLVDRDDQPDACTQCHVDRPRRWAADALAARSAGQAPVTARAAGPSAVARDLHGGDPIQRALAAHALGRSSVPVDETMRMAWLVDALRDDYPAVRWFGYRELRRLARRAARSDVLAALGAPEVMQDPGARAVMIDQLRRRLGPGALDAHPELRAELRDRRDDRAIWIGE